MLVRRLPLELYGGAFVAPSNALVTASTNELKQLREKEWAKARGVARCRVLNYSTSCYSLVLRTWWSLVLGTGAGT